MIKFSIIIPVWNLEPYISRCLDSVIAQTYKNIEIICINDGSTDNSLNILQEYAERDNRIKIIDQENQGVSVARNNGIDAASGDYLLFVDGDDYVDTRMCEVLNGKVENYDLVFFNFYRITSNGEIKRAVTRNRNTFQFSPVVWSFCFRSEFVQRERIRFPQGINIAEDVVFLSYVHALTDNALVINDPLYYHVSNRSGSATTVKKKDLFDLDIKAFSCMTESTIFKGASRERQGYIVDIWIQLILDMFFQPQEIDKPSEKAFKKIVLELKNKGGLKLKTLPKFRFVSGLFQIGLFPAFKKLYLAIIKVVESLQK